MAKDMSGSERASDANISNVNISEIYAAFIKQTYNESLGDIPDAYKSLIGNNKIAIRITGEDNTINAMDFTTKTQRHKCLTKTVPMLHF